MKNLYNVCTERRFQYKIGEKQNIFCPHWKVLKIFNIIEICYTVVHVLQTSHRFWTIFFLQTLYFYTYNHKIRVNKWILKTFLGGGLNLFITITCAVLFFCFDLWLLYMHIVSTILVSLYRLYHFETLIKKNTIFIQVVSLWDVKINGGWRGRMVVRFTTTYAISAYHHYSCEFEPHTRRGVLDTTLCDKVRQWQGGFLHQKIWPVTI